VSCVRKVNQALASLPWVEKHSVNFAGKSATISVNGKYDEAATIKAIKKAGFGASTL
jgi:copper chaperone CopZ